MPRDLRRTARVVRLLARMRKDGWRFQDIAAHPTIDVRVETVSRWASGFQTPTVVMVSALEHLSKHSRENPKRGRDKSLRDFDLALAGLIARGWKKKQLADRLGITYRQLRNYETGKSRPRGGALLPELKRMSREPVPRTQKEIVLVSLGRLADESGVYGLGEPLLAKVSGYSKSQVRRIMRQLAKQGAITQLNSEPDEPLRWKININLS